MKPISVPLYFFSDGVGQTVLHACCRAVAALRAAARARRRAAGRPTFARISRRAFAVGYCVNFFLNFLMNCDRVLDSRDVCRPAHRAMGLRPALGSDHSADALPGDPWPHRLRASLCRDLLDAAAHLRRDHPAVALGHRASPRSWRGSCSSRSSPRSSGAPQPTRRHSRRLTVNNAARRRCGRAAGGSRAFPAPAELFEQLGLIDVGAACKQRERARDARVAQRECVEAAQSTQQHDRGAPGADASDRAEPSPPLRASAAPLQLRLRRSRRP